jgi:hypothetical protein
MSTSIKSTSTPRVQKKKAMSLSPLTSAGIKGGKVLCVESRSEHELELQSSAEDSSGTECEDDTYTYIHIVGGVWLSIVCI